MGKNEYINNHSISASLSISNAIINKPSEVPECEKTIVYSSEARKELDLWKLLDYSSNLFEWGEDERMLYTGAIYDKNCMCEGSYNGFNIKGIWCKTLYPAGLQCAYTIGTVDTDTDQGVNFFCTVNFSHDYFTVKVKEGVYESPYSDDRAVIKEVEENLMWSISDCMH